MNASAVLLTAGMLCGLNACALLPNTSTPHSLDSTMTPAESKTDLYSKVDEIKALVGGEWTVNAEAGPSACTLISGGDGVYYTLGLNTAASAEPVDVVVAAVKAHWLSEGYDLFMERSGEDPTGPRAEVGVQKHDGQTFTFTASPTHMGIIAHGACAPGTVRQVREQMESGDS